MAVKYWIGGATTSNWIDDTKWSLSSGGPNDTTAAVSGDDAYFDSFSGSGTVVVTPNAVATNIYFVHPTTGSYTGTLQMTNTLTAVTNFTLSAAMAITGTGALSKSGNGGTFTSNTKAWPNDFFTPNGGGWVTTFGDNWTIGGSMIGTLNSVTINAAAMRTITVGGGINTGAGYGCLNITFVLNGTGSIGGAISGATININSPLGAITWAGVSLSNCILTYTQALSFTATGGIVVSGVSVTLNNVSTLTFPSISFGASGGQTLILNSNANTGALIVNGAQAGAINGAFTLFVSGNITPTNGLSGTATIEMLGSSNATISAGSIGNSLTINKSGVGTTVTLTGAVSQGGAGRTLNIITGNNLVLSSTLTVAGGTVLVPTGSIISGPSNLILSGTSTLDVATGITISNLAVQNTITVTLSRTTVVTNYSNLGGIVTFTAASAAELQVNNIIVGAARTGMGTNTTFRLMGGTFATFNFSGACVLNTSATITGTGVGGSGFVANGTSSLNLSAGTLVLPVISGSYRTGTGITQSQGPFTLNMGTNEIDYFSASSGGLGNGRLILQSDLKINKVFYGGSFGTSVTDNGFNIIVKESVYWKNGGFVSTGKIIYKGVPSGTGFVGTGYISGTTLTILTVTSGTLIPGQYIHCPTDSAAANLINTITTFGNTYTVVTSQTVGSAGSPVVFYGDGANADLGSPYSSPSSPRGVLEIDADSNKVYYFGGQFNSANSELRYLSSNTGDFDGSKAVVTLITTGTIGTIDFQGQSSPTKYIGTMLIANYYGGFILKSDLYVNDHQGNLGLATRMQQVGGSYSLYVMRNFSVGNGTSAPDIMQPTIRLVGPLPCTFTSSFFMGNLIIAKDSGTVVTVTQSFTYGYATPTTMTYTSGVVNFGATTMTLNGPVSIINPVTVGNFSFNNISTTAGTSVTITNPMTITGTLTLGGTTTFAGTRGFTCQNLSCTTASSVITLQNATASPLAEYTINGLLTLSGVLGGRITLQASGSATFLGTITPVGQLNYISGTIPTSGMTLSHAAAPMPNELFQLLPARPVITGGVSPTFTIAPPATGTIGTQFSMRAGYKAKFTLANGATQSVSNVTTQDIDSSAGLFIYPFNSVAETDIFRTLYWGELLPPENTAVGWLSVT